MKRMLFLIPAVLVITGFVVTSDFVPSEARQLVIRVTTANPDSEIAFSAAYLFADNARDLVVENAMTPVSITGVAESFGGIFRSADGETELRVELVERDGTVERQLAFGQGSVVMLNESSGHRMISVPHNSDE